MKSIVKPRWVLALLFCWPAISLWAEDPPPTSDQSAPADADPFNGHQWLLTPYLKGTAPQIRDTLNGESERLIVKINDAQRVVRDAKSDAASDERSVLDTLGKSPTYRQSADDEAKAQADLEEARQSGASADRIEASNRLNKARLAREKLEHEALARSPDLTRDRQAVTDAEQSLKRYQQSLKTALAWRAELLDATRNGFMLKAPVAKGDKGTLPRVTVESVPDANQVMLGYDLITLDLNHPGKEKEGIKSYSATKQRVHILAKGIDTTNMKMGESLNLDRVFIVEEIKSEENGKTYVVQPVASDVDQLFKMIVPLKEPLPQPGVTTTRQ